MTLERLMANRKPIAVGGGVMLLAIFATVLAIQLVGRDRPSASQPSPQAGSLSPVASASPEPASPTVTPSPTADAQSSEEPDAAPTGERSIAPTAPATTLAAERLPGAEGIAFVRYDDGLPFGQAYVVDDDGAVIQLTNFDEVGTTGGAQSVKWSPDGERLAYAQGLMLTGALGILDAGGGEPLMVEGGIFHWAPDGSRLAVGGQFEGFTPPGFINGLPVSVVDIVTGTPEEVGSGLLLGWHPDSTRVLVMRVIGADETTPGTPQLVLISVADGAEEELFQGASLARWSPDGSQVAYVLEDNPCVGTSCVRILAGTEGSRDLAEVGHGYDPSWSPDGSRLAYTQFAQDGGSTLTVVDLSSGGTVEFPGGGEHPTTWAPDGTRLAYATYSQERQQPFIRIVSVDSGEVILEFAGTAPSWRP